MLAARTGQAQAAAQARQQGIQNAIGVVSAIGSVASAVGGFLPKAGGKSPIGDMEKAQSSWSDSPFNPNN